MSENKGKKIGNMKQRRTLEEKVVNRKSWRKDQQWSDYHLNTERLTRTCRKTYLCQSLGLPIQKAPGVVGVDQEECLKSDKSVGEPLVWKEDEGAGLA